MNKSTRIVSKNTARKIFLSIFFLSAIGNQAQMRFTAPTNYGTNGQPISIASSDFNQDGYTDLAVANNSGGSVTVFLNSGTGDFGTGVNYVVAAGIVPEQVISTDANGDGKADLILADYSNGNVSTLLGNGDGTFGTSSNVALLPGSNTSSLASADFNQDGKADLIFGWTGYYGPCLSLGNGDGTFQSISYHFASGGPLAVTTGDFNGDGLVDAATSNYNGNTISVLLGNGSGGFSSTAGYGSIQKSYGIISADLNGDTYIDLVSANYDSSNVSVFMGTGTGTFTGPFNFAAGTNPYSVACADFDNDGKKDLAVANQGSADLSILYGDGAGNFSAGTNLPVSLGPSYVVTGDFNSDAKVDLAIANQWANNLAVIFTYSMTVNSGTVCAGNPITLTASGANTYTWSTGDNTPSAIVNPTTTTVYTVSGSIGAAVGTLTTTVNVNALPGISVSGANTICAGGNTVFNANTSSALTTFNWAPATGLSNTTGTTVIASPGATTLYTITATDSIGCKDSVNVTLTVINLPALSITGSNTVCSGSSTFLTASGALYYSWAPSTYLNSSSTDTVTSTPLSQISYTLTGSDAFGCSSTDTITLYVNATPTVSINYTDATCFGLCDGTATVTASGGQLPYSYSWSQGGNTTVITGLCANNYTATVTDANGCGSSATTLIKQPVAVQALVSLSNDTICAGVCDTLFASAAGGVGGFTYLVQPGSGNLAVNLEYPVVNTTYTLTVTDANNCKDSTTISVITNPLPVLLAVATPTTVCAADSVSLSATGALTYSWSTGQNGAVVTQYPTTASTYTVTGTDGNNCVGTSTVSVSVNQLDNLTGTITDATTAAPISAGWVYIYTQQLTAGIAFDSVAFTAGTYTINNVAAGAYYIKAVADTLVYPNSVPTYYSSTVPPSYTWSSANLASINCNNGQYDVYNIGLINLTTPTGSGVISGTVTKDPSFGQRLGIGINQPLGAPLKGVDIKLGKNPGGCAARTTTDTAGAYQFTNLDTGSYYIFVDIPNYVMDTIRYVTLTTQNLTSNHNDYIVDSNKVYIDTLGSIGIKPNGSDIEGLVIYPNPNQGTQLIIDGRELSSRQVISLYDINGRMIMTQTGSGRTVLDLHGLQDGVYTISITCNTGVTHRRLVITR